MTDLTHAAIAELVREAKECARLHAHRGNLDTCKLLAKLSAALQSLAEAREALEKIARFPDGYITEHPRSRITVPAMVRIARASLAPGVKSMSQSETPNPAAIAELAQKLRSRAWEDRQHRKLRDQAAGVIEELSTALQSLAEARGALAELVRLKTQHDVLEEATPVERTDDWLIDCDENKRALEKAYDAASAAIAQGEKT